MHTGGGTDERGVGVHVGVATALDDLKANGSALLVVGSVSEEIYARLSGSLLAGSDAADRRRIVVEHRRSPEVRFADVERWTPEWTRILRFDVAERRSVTTARSATTGQPPGFGPSPPVGTQASSGSELSPESGPVPVPGAEPDSRTSDAESERGDADDVALVDGSVTDLGVAISHAIGQLASVAGGLEPGELRVAFDCVAPLLSRYDEETVFRFLHLLANEIRAVDGMGHVRLPGPADAPTARLLAPLFDAVVELRADESGPQQRWHFRDADVTSRWLPVGSGQS